MIILAAVLWFLLLIIVVQSMALFLNRFESSGRVENEVHNKVVRHIYQTLRNGEGQ